MSSSKRSGNTADHHSCFSLPVLGCGFDPGVTGVFSAYALKHHFDEIHYIDILDANAGDHGYPFATNFNPEINIREITSNGRYWKAPQACRYNHGDRVVSTRLDLFVELP